MNYELRTKLIDTHCHLDFPDFKDDINEVIKRAKDARLEYIINIGSSLEGSHSSAELAKNFDFIYAAVGIHPHEADKFDSRQEEELKKIAENKKVVAIGEIGLDYYKNYSKAENQKELFKILAAFAKDKNLPIIIHNRDADKDTLEILKPLLPHKIVVHCFSSDDNFLKACLDSGFYISFTCNITYKNAQGLRDLIKVMPLDRLMLETDAPFLPPQELRGKRNEPAYVKYLAEGIAKIRGISFEEVAQATTQNAKEFFGLR